MSRGEGLLSCNDLQRFFGHRVGRLVLDICCKLLSCNGLTYGRLSPAMSGYVQGLVFRIETKLVTGLYGARISLDNRLKVYYWFGCETLY